MECGAEVGEGGACWVVAGLDIAVGEDGEVDEAEEEEDEKGEDEDGVDCVSVGHGGWCFFFGVDENEMQRSGVACSS